MNDKTEKLSNLMDGELRNPEQWLERLSKDTEMRDTWQRYHLVRDVLKGQLSEHPSLDISAAVSKSLEAEPVIFTPIWKRISPRYVMKQAAGLAVAAAVGTIAVLSVQQTQIGSVDNNTLATANNGQVISQPSQQLAQSGQTNKIRQVSFTTRQKLDAAVESKLSGYLVNHNEFSKSIRVSGVMPYTRIVSFVPSTSSASSNISEQVNNDK